MAQPFKFRYANEISGCFVLLLVLLFIFAMLFAGKVQGWLTPNRTVEITIPEGGSEGLREGAEVEVLGTRVGSVEVIRPEGGDLVAKLKIRDDYFKEYLREDSVAVLTKKLAGIGGDTLVKITRGKGAPLSEKGATLLVEKPKASGIDQLTKDLQGGIERIIAEVELLLREIQGLVADIRAPGGILSNVNDLIYDVRGGGGPISMALYDTNLVDRIHTTVEAANNSALFINQILARVDGLVATTGPQVDQILGQTSQAIGRAPALMDQVSGVVGDVKQTTAQVPALVGKADGLVNQVDGILGDVRNTTQQVPALVGQVDGILRDVGVMTGQLQQTMRTVDQIINTANGEAGEIPELIAQAKDTLRETEKLITGLEKHWLLRKYIEQNPGARGGPISPGELRGFERR